MKITPNIAFTFVFAFNLATEALSSTRTGNGGYGKRINGKLVSFDLAIAGNANNPNTPSVDSTTEGNLSDEESLLIERRLARVAKAESVEIVKTKLADFRYRAIEHALPINVDNLIQNLRAYLSFRESLKTARIQRSILHS